MNKKVFYVSDKWPYKYYTYHDGVKIYFGHWDYEQYKDSTGVGAFSHLDHNDKERWEWYIKRHSKIKLKNGMYAYKNKFQPAYYSMKYLWDN